MARSLLLTLFALAACTPTPDTTVQDEGYLSPAIPRADQRVAQLADQRVPGIAAQIEAAKATAGGHIAIDPNLTEPIRVMLQFDRARRDEVMSVVHGANGILHYEFDQLDAIAVTLPNVVLDALQEHPGVKYMELDQPRFPSVQTIPYGIDAVQARDVWDANRDGAVDSGAPTGAGITVCVIDSGLYTNHEDHQGANVLGGYPAGWNQDGCGHGTHVTGTINAQNNNTGVVGVSPGAVSLYIVRVFGDDCVWAYASTLVDAANRCAAAGARIISMSLGGSSRSGIEQAGFDNLYAQGILSIAAAGNDGNTRTSYPAGYGSVVSVAAVDSNNALATFSQRNSDVELSGPGVGVLSTVPFLDDTSLTVGGNTYAGTQIEFSQRGNASGTLVNGGLCDSVGSWAGRVVLCERGTVSFYDKVHNVELGGGAAAVIYNNAPGGFSGTLGAGNTSTIIGIGISQEDGQALVAGSLGQTGNVSSNFTAPASGYEAWDGTSMATPHVSGVAALVWSSNPAASNVDVRNALDSTALDLGTAGRDNSYGFGLVQAAAAIAALGGGGGGCSGNAECSDGNACNGSETCSGGSCQAGTPVTCAPGETCNPSNGTCSGGTCGAKNSSCSANTDCCSNRCNFNSGRCR
jgi:serine protease